MSTLGTLEHPVVNWQVFTDQSDGSDAYGSVIGDFSASVSASEAALERCGAGTLFPVMISSELSDGSTVKASQHRLRKRCENCVAGEPRHHRSHTLHSHDSRHRW